MPQPSETLARALDAMARAHGNRRRVTAPRDDQVLQALVNDLVAARTAAGMTQMDVAVRMLTSKSAVSRLESGRFTRPTLATIESYARAVDARVEIHVRRRR
jgi:ribosome-binding protein aMBF1 (putative translation factor)